MTITFRIDDGNVTTIPAAPVTADQLATFVAELTNATGCDSAPMLYPDYGTIDGPIFSFEARVCPLALAVVTAIFDHDPAVIAVVDEAQYLGRRVRISRTRQGASIRLELADNPDAAPELNLANGNAYALLETLGIEADSVGAVPLSELRDRLTNPTIRRRIDADPYLARKLPDLLAMGRAVKEPATARMAWS
ncbi:hypothetical protein [Sphingomonas sp. Leaf4]|uniref:hypothetical protein n=1 Tax=Sphingomonas sp. Leaf4 TaxID=2876553 RepID=UPI001E650E9E|nr:hypothetical protein [Sphingomonas sp. Leaf4]